MMELYIKFYKENVIYYVRDVSLKVIIFRNFLCSFLNI